MPIGLSRAALVTSVEIFDSASLLFKMEEMGLKSIDRESPFSKYLERFRRRCFLNYEPDAGRDWMGGHQIVCENMSLVPFAVKMRCLVGSLEMF